MARCGCGVAIITDNLVGIDLRLIEERKSSFKLKYYVLMCVGHDPKSTGPMVGVPLRLNVDESVVDLTLGAEHGMCLTQSKDVFTWGWNEHGNCGLGHDQDV